MPRFALLLIAALALLFGAAAAQAAPAGPAAAPVATAAEDLDDVLSEEEEECGEECSDESWDDADAACGDELWGDEDWAGEEDDEIVDDAEPAAEAATDECAEGEPVVAPELTALSASVAGEDARLRVQVAFRLDQAGPVELTLARAGAVASRHAKRACPSGRGAAAKKGKKCGGSLPGKLTVTGKAGLNRVELRGRWRGKKLAPGSYRLTATPKAAGATSDAVTFKIAAS